MKEEDPYSLGIEAAISHLREIIQNWVEDKSAHDLCRCPSCRFLRQLAGRHAWRPLAASKNLEINAVRTYTAGYRVGLGIIQDAVKKWVRLKTTHSSCTCACCRELRLIAGKKYDIPLIM